MNEEILFSENQRFKQWWVWLILLSLNGFFFYGIYRQVLKVEQFGDRPMSNAGLIIFTGLFLLLSYLFFRIKLETQVKADGIYVRFFPFHRSFKFYPWNEISHSYVRKYSALLEYGGWGIRFGTDGKAYNVSGNQGLQLEFLNKKKLLIGTNLPEELSNTLNKIGHLSP